MYSGHYLVLFLLCTVHDADAFLTQPIPGLSKETLSQRDITTSGVFRAVSRFLKDNDLVSDKTLSDTETIEHFFRWDGRGYLKFLLIMEEIINHMNTFHDHYQNVAYRNFNGEELEIGNIKLMQIKKSISRITSSNDNYKLYSIKKKVGEYLYTLQAFYSNTNWVEMEGARPNPDLGIREFSNKVAHDGLKVCTNCRKVDGECKGNLEVTDVLTSGYRAGQDIKKPQLHNRNKCSHGGMQDESRNVPALGGINKETTIPELSPHHYLHKDAAAAAINATDDFIGSKDHGLQNILGFLLFRDVFNLWTAAKPEEQRGSLGFAIDVSGSMGSVINTVIEKTTEAVTGLMNTPNDPGHYVLSTFNDPENATTGFHTTRGSEIIHELQSLRAGGGGDCPEYAVSGLKKAVALSRENSKILFFTDASAKDASNVWDLIQKARAKKVRIIVMMPGRCRYTRTKRQLIPENLIYEEIANETGGSFHNGSTDLPSITEDEIGSSLPSALVLLDYFKLDAADPDEKFFFVESNLTNFRVFIRGPNSENDATLTDPDGSPVDFSSEYAYRVFLQGTGLFITVTNPQAGEWKLSRTVKAAWSLVNITTQSLLDFKVQVLDMENTWLPKPVSGNLIHGRTYRLISTLTRLPAESSVTSVSLHDDDGPISTPLSLEDISNPPIETRFYTSFSANTSIKTVILYGKDYYGNDFQRATLVSFTVVNVELNVDFVLEEVAAGSMKNISYTVKNTGSENDTYQAKFEMEDRNDSQIHVLQPDENTTSYFTFRTPTDMKPFMYTIKVVRTSEPEYVLQEMYEILEVASKRRLECHLSELHGKCDIAALNTVNCSLALWKVMYKIDSGDVSIQRIFLSNNGPSTNFTLEEENATRVFVRGDCCNPNVIVNILDNEHTIQRCNYDFADGLTLTEITQDDVNADKVKEKNHNDVIVGVTAAGVVALVTLVVLAVVLRQKKFGLNTKKSSTTDNQDQINKY